MSSDNVSIEEKQIIDNFITLADSEIGKSYKIISVSAGHNLIARLNAMGLAPGEVFNVISHYPKGPATIAVKGSRFAIGRGMAEKIIISEQ